MNDEKIFINLSDKLDLWFKVKRACDYLLDVDDFYTRSDDVGTYENGQSQKLRFAMNTLEELEVLVADDIKSEIMQAANKIMAQGIAND